MFLVPRPAGFLKILGAIELLHVIFAFVSIGECTPDRTTPEKADKTVRAFDSVYRGDRPGCLLPAHVGFRCTGMKALLQV